MQDTGVCLEHKVEDWQCLEMRLNTMKSLYTTLTNLEFTYNEKEPLAVFKKAVPYTDLFLHKCQGV